MTEDERAIRDLVATWMTASQAGDTAAVLSLMADDVIFQVPGREPFGKEAFAAASPGMKNVRIEGTANILGLSAELHLDGNNAARRHSDPAGRLYPHDPAQGSERQMADGTRREPRGGGEIIGLG